MQPGHADAVAHGKAADAFAEFVHHADDFVPQNQGAFVQRQVALGNVNVGAADAAGHHLDADFACPGMGFGHFDHAQGAFLDGGLFFEQPGFHGFLLLECLP